ncbi:MAG: hypothetical protein WBC71_04025, partial [Salaquimonas sp.]
MTGGFRAWGIESLKVQSPLSRAAFFVPIVSLKSAKLELRTFYEERGSHRGGQVRDDFSPEDVGEWFYRRIADWSANLPSGSANVHDFRKTTLQYARSGEDVNRQVAADAHVSAEVI